MTGKRKRPGLPLGRAKYRTKDAYAAQSREYETRTDQSPGYIKAVLQANFPVLAGVNAVIVWQTTSLSVFFQVLQKFGWSYDSVSGAFICRRPGLYQISAAFRTLDAVAGENFQVQIKVVRGIFSYILFSRATAGGAFAQIGLMTDFDFQEGDILDVHLVNEAAATRNFEGYSGAGTATELQPLGYFNLWQLD